MIILRNNYLQKLVDSKRDGLIKVVTGPRRCGKSYLLTQLFHSHLTSNGVTEDHIIEISLEDRQYKELRNPDKMLSYVSDCIKDNALYYLIIDEVQMLDEFVDVLNSFLHIRNLDVYVTGSNSRFLSTDIATEFRGRDHQIRLYPLSFSEYYSAVGGDELASWREYYTFGGLPQTLQYSKREEKVSYLRNIFRTAYMSDIIDRYHIKNEPEMERLVQILASSIGSPTNPYRISNTFKSVEDISISGQTIERYISHLTDAFLLSKADRYDVKGRKYIGTLSKYYFEDLGIRNALLNYRQLEESHLMENVIYNELCLRGYQVDVGDVEFRRRNSEGVIQRGHMEIDFVVNHFSKRYYIQSALSIPDRDKMKQESQSLLEVNDAFKKIIIVKESSMPWHNEQGILIIGLMDFLLDKVSLDY